MIVVVTPADVLPVGLATALRHLRVQQADADLARLYLEAATELVEDYTGRALISKEYRLDLPLWPSYPYTDGIRSLSRPRTLQLELRRSPLTTVESIKYYPEDGGALATLSADSYRVRTGFTHSPGLVEFDEDIEFPTIANRSDAVQVAFTAGYGDSEYEVPASLRSAVLLLARHFFDNRSALGDIKQVELPLGYKNILRAYRIESRIPVNESR